MPLSSLMSGIWLGRSSRKGKDAGQGIERGTEACGRGEGDSSGSAMAPVRTGPSRVIRGQFDYALSGVATSSQRRLRG